MVFYMAKIIIIINSKLIKFMFLLHLKSLGGDWFGQRYRFEVKKLILNDKNKPKYKFYDINTLNYFNFRK